jgi:hypothetical protein
VATGLIQQPDGSVRPSRSRGSASAPGRRLRCRPECRRRHNAKHIRHSRLLALDHELQRRPPRERRAPVLAVKPCDGGPHRSRPRRVGQLRSSSIFAILTSMQSSRPRSSIFPIGANFGSATPLPINLCARTGKRWLSRPDTDATARGARHGRHCFLQRALPLSNLSGFSLSSPASERKARSHCAPHQLQQLA